MFTLIMSQAYTYTTTIKVFKKFRYMLSPSFLEEVGKSYRQIRPYFDLMSEILTTNLNGESILD